MERRPDRVDKLSESFLEVRVLYHFGPLARVRPYKSIHLILQVFTNTQLIVYQDFFQALKALSGQCESASRQD
jgi:hypothetical protein